MIMGEKNLKNSKKSGDKNNQFINNEKPGILQAFLCEKI